MENKIKKITRRELIQYNLGIFITKEVEKQIGIIKKRKIEKAEFKCKCGELLEYTFEKDKTTPTEVECPKCNRNILIEVVL